MELAELSWEYTDLVLPFVAVVIAVSLVKYVHRLTDSISASRAFRSRGFKQFDKIIVDGEEGTLLCIGLWSCDILIVRNGGQEVRIIPNTRLPFLDIRRRITTRIEAGGSK